MKVNTVTRMKKERKEAAVTIKNGTTKRITIKSFNQICSVQLVEVINSCFLIIWVIFNHIKKLREWFIKIDIYALYSKSNMLSWVSHWSIKILRIFRRFLVNFNLKYFISICTIFENKNSLSSLTKKLKLAHIKKI